jgi:hypothetical protein
METPRSWHSRSAATTAPAAPAARAAENSSSSSILAAIVVLAVVILVVALVLRMRSPDAGNKKPDPQAPKSGACVDPELAAALKSSRVRLYGANYCSFTVRQLDVIGGPSAVQYIECTGDGQDPRCAKVTGYPTWEIDGNLYPGYRGCEQLKKLIKNPPPPTPPAAEAAAPPAKDPLMPAGDGSWT